MPVVADVGRAENLARTAVAEFGRVDTWVNHAGVPISGPADEVPLEDVRLMFDSNHRGVVHVRREALAHRRSRDRPAGAGHHGGQRVRGTVRTGAVHLRQFRARRPRLRGSLRMELQAVSAPVSVTLLQEVAEAVLHAATHPMNRSRRRAVKATVVAAAAARDERGAGWWTKRTQHFPAPAG